MKGQKHRLHKRIWEGGAPRADKLRVGRNIIPIIYRPVGKIPGIGNVVFLFSRIWQ